MQKNRMLTENVAEQYRRILVEEERSETTIEKYLFELEKLKDFAGERMIDKVLMVSYKEKLVQTYRPRSVNVKISALNGFFKRMEWYECILKQVKLQKESFRVSSRVLNQNEYRKLLATARRLGKKRISLVIQTICSMGLRVSELEFITAEAVRNGYAEVTLKGKSRIVLMPEDLQTLLINYIREQGMENGCVFVSRSGKPLNRSNIWRDMKILAKEAGVLESKVFPHNLRHLFACVYYAEEKNANQLADILGHSSLNTTRIYTQVSMDEELAALNRMHLVNLSDFHWEDEPVINGKGV